MNIIKPVLEKDISELKKRITANKHIYEKDIPVSDSLGDGSQ
jgi:hypothetical protein